MFVAVSGNFLSEPDPETSLPVSLSFTLESLSFGASFVGDSVFGSSLTGSSLSGSSLLGSSFTGSSLSGSSVTGSSSTSLILLIVID
ncbi:pentapeptide repeat-containing protein [Alkalihalobacillus alcalophilus]|uniref:pentapeptide repeat-containing protein n=1 Tax=Alkalihalobacillus alcalophilus TaxID=1445 RepID=UPI0038B3360F